MGIRRLCSCGARRGFTLIECAIAIVIVGVGVVAAMQLFATCTATNSVASSASTATFLANNVHELILSKPFWPTRSQFGLTTPVTPPITSAKMQSLVNITTFNGAKFNPPVDADGNLLDGSDDGTGKKKPDLSAYTQEVTIEPLDNTAATPWTVAKAPVVGSKVSVFRIRVSVSVSSQGKSQSLCTSTWLCAE